MDKKIYVWGTGNIGKSVVQNGIMGEMEGWVETIPSLREVNGKRVIGPEDLTGNEIVVVATIYADEIFESLQKEKTNMENYLFFCKCKKIDCKSNLDLAKRVFSPKNLQIYLSNYGAYECSFFSEDLAKYQERNRRSSFAIESSNNRPIITDKYDDMGTVDDSFWESVWVASRIRENMPTEHYDIGSRLNGFLSIIIAMGIPLKVIDVRPFPVQIDGMECIVDDATELREFADNSIESLSAVSSLEHFGLGRYGDEIDPEACFKCFANIQQKMRGGGKLYITVPIGRERCCFNAHRFFRPGTILSEFDRMKLIEFSYIDGGKLYRNADLCQFDNYENNHVCNGLFSFEKIGV